MATQSQTNAVTKLHGFSLGDEIQAEYPFYENGVIVSGKTSYQIDHRDPYELMFAKKNGGTASASLIAILTMGTSDSGQQRGYKSGTSQASGYGDLAPKMIGKYEIFTLSSQLAQVGAFLRVSFNVDGVNSKVDGDLVITINGNDYPLTFAPTTGNTPFYQTQDATAISDFNSVPDGSTQDVTITLTI